MEKWAALPTPVETWEYLRLWNHGLRAVGRHSRVISEAPAREPCGVVTI